MLAVLTLVPLALTLQVGRSQAVHAVPAAPRPAAAADTPFHWADYDGDGFVDALAAPLAGASRLLRNRGDGTFADATAESGLPPLVGLRFAAWIDFDGDERIDLLVTDAEGLPSLWHNAGRGAFEEWTDVAGLGAIGPVSSFEWIDLEGDGKPDLHVATETGHRVLSNSGGGQFTPLDLGTPAPASGARTAKPPARGAGQIGATAPGITRLPPHQPATSVGICAFTLEDMSTGTCISASSVPTLGDLYPLGNEFFIDAGGNVGIGTTSPTARLDVVGGKIRVHGGAGMEFLDGSEGVGLEVGTGGGTISFNDNGSLRSEMYATATETRWDADTGPLQLNGAVELNGPVTVPGPISIGTAAPAPLPGATAMTVQGNSVLVGEVSYRTTGGGQSNLATDISDVVTAADVNANGIFTHESILSGPGGLVNHDNDLLSILGADGNPATNDGGFGGPGLGFFDQVFKTGGTLQMNLPVQAQDGLSIAGSFGSSSVMTMTSGNALNWNLPSSGMFLRDWNSSAQVFLEPQLNNSLQNQLYLSANGGFFLQNPGLGKGGSFCITDALLAPPGGGGGSSPAFQFQTDELQILNSNSELGCITLGDTTVQGGTQTTLCVDGISSTRNGSGFATFGVYGNATGTALYQAGVYGEVGGSGGVTRIGVAGDGNTTGYGVQGFSAANNGVLAAVWALTSASTGTPIAVRADCDAATGWALDAQGRVRISENTGMGTGGTAPTHKLHIKATTGGTGFQSALRLEGNEGSFAWGARLNFGDSNFVYLWEDEDDHLRINGETRFEDRVGINQLNPSSSYWLDVNGAIRCTSLTQTSDARLKTDIQTLEGALDAVLAMRGVDFEWDAEAFPEQEDCGGRNIGFLAQEVREVLPEVVTEDEDGLLAVSYAEVVPVLVEAIQEQQEHIEELELQASRVTELEETVRALAARLALLED